MLAGGLQLIPPPVGSARNIQDWLGDALYQPQSPAALRPLEALGRRSVVRAVTDAGRDPTPSGTTQGRRPGARRNNVIRTTPHPFVAGGGRSRIFGLPPIDRRVARLWNRAFGSRTGDRRTGFPRPGTGPIQWPISRRHAILRHGDQVPAPRDECFALPCRLPTWSRTGRCAAPTASGTWQGEIACIEPRPAWPRACRFAGMVSTTRPGLKIEDGLRPTHVRPNPTASLHYRPPLRSQSAPIDRCGALSEGHSLHLFEAWHLSFPRFAGRLLRCPCTTILFSAVPPSTPRSGAPKRQPLGPAPVRKPAPCGRRLRQLWRAQPTSRFWNRPRARPAPAGMYIGGTDEKALPPFLFAEVDRQFHGRGRRRPRQFDRGPFRTPTGR